MWAGYFLSKLVIGDKYIEESVVNNGVSQMVDPITRFLNESIFQRGPGIFGRGRGAGNGMNAPTMAYLTVHGEMPNPPIFGREASHMSYDEGGVYIDKHIPRDIVKKLNNIDGIELRSSCEGDSERHLTYLIIRNVDRSTKTASKITNRLNREKNIRAIWNVGREGHPRICISTNLWYSKENKTEFMKWWKELPKIIIKCIV
jgi:hypothetical protein